MKKGILVLLGMFLMVSTVEAKNGNYLPNNNRGIYAYENAINFIENGIEFFVFVNGDFDFDTRLNNTFYTRNGFRINHNNTRVFRDFRGRINRIGNTLIRYNIRGNVFRIGNIHMRYFGNRLTNVGNLFVNYDRWGNPFFNGDVRGYFHNFNGVNVNVNVGRIFNFNDNFFNRPNFRRNYTRFREDHRYFYYRANRKGGNGNNREILRRRKPSNLNANNNRIKRNRNNTYRRGVDNARTTKRNSSNSIRRNADVRKNNVKENKRNRTIANSRNKNIRKANTVNSRRNADLNRKPSVKRKGLTENRGIKANSLRKNKTKEVVKRRRAN
ncbi:hypothetical protein [uncultured Polaribacter sp.]|uniref:hypothetical protein n=1 Tax=uncultured Polaribacter sp. TaxID=174711 RepID=UPI002632E01D|nr:hypothetical protein [uncultured Polaribacter sp.]